MFGDLVVVIILIAVLGFGIGIGIQRAVKASKPKTWTWEEHPRQVAGVQYTFVELTCPGEERVQVAKIPTNAADYDDQIAEARVQAQYQRTVYNSRHSYLGR